LGLDFVATLWYNMRFLPLSLSRFLLGVGWVRVCVSLSLSSLQLLEVSFIVYWECGCVCECDPELVMEYPESLVVFSSHEGEEDRRAESGVA